MRRPRIAIVDDDRAHLSVLGDVLEGEGYTALARDDLREGFVFVKDEQPDLVILDLLQGRRPIGLELIQRLRADPATRALPIIVITADGRTLHAQSAAWAADGIRALEKPYVLDDLLRHVRAALALNQPIPEP